MRKWNDANIKEVLGIDISPNEIEEAKKRLVEMGKHTDTYKFEVRDGENISEVEC